MSVKFETHRLVLHYLFIFISLAVTSILYILIFLSLRKRNNRQKSISHSRSNSRSHSQLRKPDTSPPSTVSRPESSRGHCSDPENQSSSSKAKGPVTASDVVVNTTTSTPATANLASSRKDDTSGHHKAFLLYPVIYVVCTAPLALGRIATMAKVNVPISYFCVAGALIGSNGWLDVLVWGVTRRSLLFGSDVGSEETGLDTFTFMRTPHDRRYGNIVWVEGAVGCAQQSRGEESREVTAQNRPESTGHGSLSRWRSWRNRIEGLVGWQKLDFGMISLSSEKSHRHGRTISQESLRGYGTDRRSIRHHQQGQDHEGLHHAMSGGIHMDMVTSVVVVERPDLEKENREYLERTRPKCLLEYCKNTMGYTKSHQGNGGNGVGTVDIDNMDLPELQDPSGYLTSASVDDLSPPAAVAASPKTG